VVKRGGCLLVIDLGGEVESVVVMVPIVVAAPGSVVGRRTVTARRSKSLVVGCEEGL
jgi:hypothetical protein